jgi:hypothetical protein
MKQRSWLFVLAAIAFFASTGWAADPVIVLSLKAKRGADTVSTVDFYTCDKDPNVKRAQCEQYVMVDKRRVNVPDSLLQRLDNLRRPFSYDSLSGGVRRETRQAMCMMGGPAMGSILEVRYLTYDQSFRIVADDMKPVLGIAENCLFTDLTAPINADARENARAAAEALATIREMAQPAR